MIKDKEEVEGVDIFQVVGDQGVEVDLVDVDGVTVDADMSPIGAEVEIEIVVQALQVRLILRLFMSTKSKVIEPMIVRRLET